MFLTKNHHSIIEFFAFKLGHEGLKSRALGYKLKMRALCQTTLTRKICGTAGDPIFVSIKSFTVDIR